MYCIAHGSQSEIHFKGSVRSLAAKFSLPRAFLQDCQVHYVLQRLGEP